VNHLEPARIASAIATAIAQAIDPTITAVHEIPKEGFIAYEWIAQDAHLGEPGPRKRGAMVTSIDAMIVGIRSNGQRVLVLIEWKYLESYTGASTLHSRRGTARMPIYQPLLIDPACPITPGEPEALFLDPFDQLMRQTLLAWRMAKAREFEADDWVHTWIIPHGNTALRQSPSAPHTTIQQAWQARLRAPSRFRMLTPTELLKNVDPSTGPAGWREALHDRYLT
jgi:hypothetical protein